MNQRRVDTVPRHLTRYTQHHTIDQPPERPIAPGTAGGDAQSLRGIPAIGRNVRGAIRGTVPHLDGIQ